MSWEAGKDGEGQDKGGEIPGDVPGLNSPSRES